MPKFGSVSYKQYNTLCKELQQILDDVIIVFDFSILEGFRNEEDQNKAYARGVSQKKWPQGKHNKNPSNAVDIAPYPIDWSNKEAARQRFCYLAGFVMYAAIKRGIKLRWGGDWDGDRDTRDEHFRDLGHFEVIRTEPEYTQEPE